MRIYFIIKFAWLALKYSALRPINIWKWMFYILVSDVFQYESDLSFKDALYFLGAYKWVLAYNWANSASFTVSHLQKAPAHFCNLELFCQIHISNQFSALRIYC